MASKKGNFLEIAFWPKQALGVDGNWKCIAFKLTTKSFIKRCSIKKGIQESNQNALKKMNEKRSNIFLEHIKRHRGLKQ